MFRVVSGWLALALLMAAECALAQTGATLPGDRVIDADADGIRDSLDLCPDSAPGYPVRENGCALLDGVLKGVTFTEGTDRLAPGAHTQLDSLARLLKRYPDARIDILAHTDSRGTVRDQAILSRQRLKAVATYLQKQGVSARRLVLRSYGGTRPLYRNDTPQGRDANNRIEVIENLR